MERGSSLNHLIVPSTEYTGKITEYTGITSSSLSPILVPRTRTEPTAELVPPASYRVLPRPPTVNSLSPTASCPRRKGEELWEKSCGGWNVVRVCVRACVGAGSLLLYSTLYCLTGRAYAARPVYSLVCAPQQVC